VNSDLIMYGGRVITMDPAGTVAPGIAIRAGKVQLTGTDEEVLATAGPGTSVIDLAGRTVVPGLIDSHTHVELTTYSRHYWNDIRGHSPDEILDQVKSLAAATPPGQWLIFQGTFGQDLPGRAALDQAAPDHPVAVRWSMHKFQLNTAALAAAAITRATVPGPGIRITKDHRGEPTGLVEEGWDLLRLSPPETTGLRAAMTETVRELFVRHGITTINEIAASTSGLAALRGTTSGDEVLPAFGLALTAQPGHQALISTESFGKTGLASGFGSPELSLRAVKIFVDGGRDGALRAALMSGPATGWGLLTRAPQALSQEVAAAVEAGLAVWIHAIGDLAQECAVTAIENVALAYPGLDHRCRIEHFGNEMYEASRLDRLIAAGGIPAPNPSFITAEPDDPAKRLPPEVVKYGMRTLLAAGARPPGNSDTAGAQPFACNPWYTMHCMVNRQNKSGHVIDPGEALTVAEALRSFTVDAAYGCGMESDRGSLEPGKRADLAVLTEDPFAIPVSRLKGVTSELTVIAGQPAWPPASGILASAVPGAEGTGSAAGMVRATSRGRGR
jgi:predicted amidohydrolase YtcJ